MAFIFEACSCNSYTAAAAQQTRGGNQGLLRSNGAYFIYVRDVKTIFKEILSVFSLRRAPLHPIPYSVHSCLYDHM